MPDREDPGRDSRLLDLEHGHHDQNLNSNGSAPRPVGREPHRIPPLPVAPVVWTFGAHRHDGLENSGRWWKPPRFCFYVSGQW